MILEIIFITAVRIRPQPLMAKNYSPFHARSGILRMAAAMPPPPPVLLLLLLLLATPARARTTSQFQDFFPAWRGTLVFARDNDCAGERDAYNDPSNTDRMAAYNLVGCLLAHLPEFAKLEMSIVAVVLGLLPTALMLLGPTTDEISLLARRRPLLALLLALAMPSVRPAPESAFRDPAAHLRRPVGVRAPSVPLAWPAVRPLLALAEYAAAGVAAANLCYQAASLARLCITVSAIAIDSGPIPQTYGPVLWIFLLLAVHTFGGLASCLGFGRVRDDAADVGRPRGTKRGAWVWRRLAREVTPCYYGGPVLLAKRRLSEYRQCLLTVARHVTQAGTVILFMFATVMLSSQIFISMGDVFVVVSTILAGAWACRLILTFELHGMREATSPFAQQGMRQGAAAGHSSEEKLAGDIAKPSVVASNTLLP